MDPIPFPFPSLEEGVRKNNTKSDRAAQLGLRPVPKDENQIEGVDIKEKACRMSGSVKGVVIDDMKAFLARKKQERDQRGKKLVPKTNTSGERNGSEPSSNQTLKPNNPGGKELRLNINGKNTEADYRRGEENNTGTFSVEKIENWVNVRDIEKHPKYSKYRVDI